MEKYNEQLKREVDKKFKGLMFNVAGDTVRLLSKQTLRIVVECNDGNVCDVKPEYKC